MNLKAKVVLYDEEFNSIDDAVVNINLTPFIVLVSRTSYGWREGVDFAFVTHKLHRAEQFARNCKNETVILESAETNCFFRPIGGGDEG